MLILGLQKTTLLDYPHHVASTIFTGGCNFRCPYCHNGDLVLNPTGQTPYSEEEIFDHLSKRRALIDGVVITGGEPTLYNDLPQFIEKIRQMDLLVKLDTNGSNPSMLKYLLDNQLLDYVAMDIKHCREKYNQIALCSNLSINAIDESINLLINGNVDYEFRTTLARELHSKTDILAIGQWILDAKAYYLQPYKESEQVINPIFSPHSLEELKDFVNELHAFVSHVELRGLD